MLFTLAVSIDGATLEKTSMVRRKDYDASLECPKGYNQVGTLSKNNDVAGQGLGQFIQASIDGCRKLCDETFDCVAFMYGGRTSEKRRICELADTRKPDNSWGTNFRFCALDSSIECPKGYYQVGTLSSNNDVSGVGLGKSIQISIDDCRNHCDETPNCVAFMYGGRTPEQTSICELADNRKPNNSWGTNFRFCASSAYYLFQEYISCL